MIHSAALWVLLLACLGVSICTQAQITLKIKNQPVCELLKEIERQRGIHYWCNETLLADAKKVTIHVVNAPIEEVLAICSKGQYFIFSYKNGVIEMKPRLICIEGKIVNSVGDPMSEVTIRVAGTDIDTTSGEDGKFKLNNVYANALLLFSSVNIISDSMPLNGNPIPLIKVQEKMSELREIDVVVRTGYRSQQKEKFTGPIAVADKEVLDKRVSNSALEKAESNIPGFLMTRNTNPGTNQSDEFSLTPRVTIYANPNALMVMDQFSIQGQFKAVDPEIIESIAVQKDATGTSQHGTRAGNGVLIVNTKQAKYNQPFRLSFNLWTNVESKPDLFYGDAMSSADYIDFEHSLFIKGMYRPLELSPLHPALSPAVEAMIAKRNGSLTEEGLTQKLDSLGSQDYRSQAMDRLYRKKSIKHVSLDMSGGENWYGYSLLLSHNFIKPEIKGSDEQQFTLLLNNKIQLRKKLELVSKVSYTANSSKDNGGVPVVSRPYAMLEAPNGSSASMPLYLRQTYLDTAGGGNLLDWNYYPYEEFKLRNIKTFNDNLLLSTWLHYKIIKGLDVNFFYQFQKLKYSLKDIKSRQSFYTRNLVNEYTQASANGFSQMIPWGDILDESVNKTTGNTFRLQINYEKKFGNLSSLDVLAGKELSITRSLYTTDRIYGYATDRPNGINGLDYRTPFSLYYFPAGTAIIPDPSSVAILLNKYISYFANINYNYRKLHLFSVSSRLDKSNLFGVSANNRSIPLYSAGSGWNMSSEGFYKVKWLPDLQFRVNYGTSGNSPNNASAVTTIKRNGINSNGDPTASINNPPLKSLKWEQVNTLSASIYFRLKKSIIEGSLDWYLKNSKDVLASRPLDPTTGSISIVGNVASMSGRQIDLTLNSKNINKKMFKWKTGLIASVIKDQVKSYNDTLLPSWYYTENQYLSVVPGKPLYAIYSYPFGGLDHDTGDPLTIDKSKDYNAVLSKTGIDHLIFHGRSTPGLFGALTNDFSWRDFSLSVTINFKFNYYFRKRALNYYKLINGTDLSTNDYKSRWQKSGDELTTNIPSSPDLISLDENRDLFYAYSNINIRKGDHIRINNIYLNYDINKLLKKWHFQQANIYVSASNVGIIWRAISEKIDADWLTGYPQPRIFSIGFKGMIK